MPAEMIDAGGLGNVVAIVIAAAVGVVAGARRGVANVKGKADDEIGRLVSAQATRLELLERQNSEMRDRIGELEDEVRKLREELDLEKRITARLAHPTPPKRKPRTSNGHV